MSREHVLIVEDDPDIREGVRILLESEDYVVDEAEDGREGMDKLSSKTDLVILDVMMPGLSGIRTCEEIRKISNVPVLFLTAKAQESDKLLGLMAGGDDYLAKPFSYVELLGRVKALLRRYKVYMGKDEMANVIKSEYLEVDYIKIHKFYNEVFIDGKLADLSETEYRILLLMMQFPGKVFSAQNIYESVWNEPYYYSCNGTVTVHIRNLRLKVEKDTRNPVHIKTVWGKGYRFESRDV